MMNWKQTITIVSIALCLFARTKTVQAAAHIIWSTPATITDENDVSTAGTLVAAYNIGDSSVSSTTINGVPFTAFPIADGGTSTTHGSLTVMGFSDEAMSTAASLGSGSAPFSGLSANYQTMLGTGVTKSSGSVHFLDMMLHNLNVGETYTLQIWTNNSNAITTTASLWDTFGDHVQAIDINTSATDAAGGVGQYLFGTFTADDADEPFHIHGDPFPSGVAVLNGLQLRSNAVPEPATLGLLVSAGTLLLSRRTRRCGYFI